LKEREVVRPSYCVFQSISQIISHQRESPDVHPAVSWFHNMRKPSLPAPAAVHTGCFSQRT